MTFIVVGGTCVDVLFASVPRLPSGMPGVDEFTSASLVLVDDPPVMTIGGNAGNAAVTLAKLGAAVRLVTTWGDDVAGTQVATWLGRTTCETVNLGLHRSTSVNVTATARDGARMTLFHGPGFTEEGREPLRRAATCERSDVLLLTGYPHASVETMELLARRARSEGATVALDIGPAVARFDAATLLPLLAHLDLVFCNELELAELWPDAASDDALARLTRRFAGGVVVKRGRRGAAFRRGGTGLEVGTEAVAGASTVGAGDVFDAAFLHAWAEGASPEESLRRGCATATEAVRRGGDVLALPHSDEHERTVR